MVTGRADMAATLSGRGDMLPRQALVRFGAEPAGRLGRLIVMTALHPRHLLAAAVAAGLLAGCTSPHTQQSSPGASSPAAPATPPPAKVTGLIPAPPGLTDRLVLLRTHVTAGTPIEGTLIVTYRGPVPINLNRRCQPRYAVVVTNDRHPPDAAFFSDCSPAPFIIRPGQNRLAVTVLTTYLSCSEVASQATSQSPACGPQPMSPLPRGRYEAVLVGNGILPLPAPVPVPVVLEPR
jgi:hypothetical protein